MGKLEIYKYLFLLNSFFLHFRNQSLLSYVKARTHFISLLTYFLPIFFMYFRGCSVSHVNQSRAVSTLEDWLSHGKA